MLLYLGRDFIRRSLYLRRDFKEVVSPYLGQNFMRWGRL